MVNPTPAVCEESHQVPIGCETVGWKSMYELVDTLGSAIVATVGVLPQVVVETFLYLKNGMY